MKYRHMIAATAVVLLICLITIIVGCTTSRGRVVADIMSQIPENATYFTFADIETLRNDKSLEVTYKAWRSNHRYTLDDYGIVTDDVNRTALGFSSHVDGCYLIYGDFNLDKLRDKRDSLGFNVGEHRGVELWERTDELVALMEDVIISGTEQSVRDCIDVMKGEKDSLWDKQDARDMIEILPDGFSMICSFDPQRMSYEGVIAQGTSVGKIDAGTLQMTGIYMFADEDTARDLLMAIEEYMEAIDPEADDVTQNGRFVIGTTHYGIDEMIMIQ